MADPPWQTAVHGLCHARSPGPLQPDAGSLPPSQQQHHAPAALPCHPPHPTRLLGTAWRPSQPPNPILGSHPTGPQPHWQPRCLRSRGRWHLAPQPSCDLHDRGYHHYHPQSWPPLLWWMAFPKSITKQLMSTANHHGSLTNLDLKLTGSLLHLDAATQNYDVHKQTLLSKTDNMATLYWQCKGAATTMAAYLLWLQAWHQCHHQYLLLHDYLPRPQNNMSNDASWMHHLSDNQLLTHFNSSYPQNQSWFLWHPTPSTISAMVSALHRMLSALASFLGVRKPPTPNGLSGPIFVANSILTPTQGHYQSYTLPPSLALPINIGPETCWPVVNWSGLEWWQLPYKALPKCSSVWEPMTHASTNMATSISA